MSLVLAPFHHGMRLGQGFNSFSQELRINDAVQKPGGIRASDSDLRRVIEQESPGNESHKDDAALLSNSSGTLSRKIPNTQISQTVKWEARFVQHLSDITRRMDVSGAHVIKSDALGSASKSQGHFFDEIVFKNADLNYLVRVDVLNQRLLGESVTQFMPMRTVAPARFTEVYGDSFISGFLEGGTFNALVSIKLSKTMSSALVQHALTNAFMGLSGLEDFSDLLGAHESSISVAWSGGGEVMPNDATQWDITSLRKAAMNFPNAVAACPERTSAIITKYTALRSFHEQSQRGFPLSYENAGFHAHDLLDSYSDYKMILASLHALVNDLGKNRIELHPQERRTDLTELAAKIQKAIDQRGEAMAAQRQQLSFAAFTNAISPKLGDETNTIILEESLPPNPLIPYNASIVGLEEALHDARFEMTKIAKEVDKLTMYPQILSDVSRPPQFISPAIFKLLIPTTNLTSSGSSDSQEVVDALTKAKNEAVVALQATQSQIEALQERQKDLDTQLEVSTAKFREANNIVENQGQQLSILQADATSYSERITELTSQVKTMEFDIQAKTESITLLNLGKDFMSAKLSNSFHKESSLCVVATKADYASVEITERLNALLDNWSGGEDATKPFSMTPGTDLDVPASEPEAGFSCDFEFYRGDRKTGQTGNWSFNLDPGLVATMDFHKYFLYPFSPTYEYMAPLIEKIDANRLKGINFKFTQCVGAPMEKELIPWETAWPDVDEFDVVTEITFYKREPQEFGGIIGVSLKSTNMKEPYQVGEMSENFERCALSSVERIIAAELRGGVVPGYATGDYIGLTAVRFWTSTGRIWGFDSDPRQLDRERWFGMAPMEGYVLKGLWGGRSEIFDRVGIIWGIDAPAEERLAEELSFCKDYESLAGPWRQFADKFKRPDWKMSSVAGFPTDEDGILSPIDSVPANHPFTSITIYQGVEDLYGVRTDYFEDKPVMIGNIHTGEATFEASDSDPIVAVAIACGESPTTGSKGVPVRIQLIRRAAVQCQGIDSNFIDRAVLHPESPPVVISPRPDASWSFKGFAIQSGTQMIRSMAVLWGKDQ